MANPRKLHAPSPASLREQRTHKTSPKLHAILIKLHAAYGHILRANRANRRMWKGLRRWSEECLATSRSVSLSLSLVYCDLLLISLSSTLPTARGECQMEEKRTLQFCSPFSIFHAF